MKQQQCLLCGQEYPTGLNVMGCLICFPCERSLLTATAVSMNRRRRQNLFKLYGTQCTKVISH